MTILTIASFQLGPFTIRYYALLINLGLILAMFYSHKQLKNRNMDPEIVWDLVLYIMPLAILFARLYYVAFNLDYYLAHPDQILAIWHGGLAIHGGIIGGLLGGYIYVKRHKLDFLLIVDIIIPSLALAQSIGRWGNYINGEAYGYETNLPWAIFVDGAYRHPTFLYESIWDFALFLFLYYVWKKAYKYKGQLFSYYLIIYSVGRFWIEALRTDSLMLGPIRVAQLISVAMIILGLWMQKHLGAKQKSDSSPEK